MYPPSVIDLDNKVYYIHRVYSSIKCIQPRVYSVLNLEYIVLNLENIVYST